MVVSAEQSPAPPFPSPPSSAVALAVALLRPWIKRLEREVAAAEGMKEASQLNVRRRDAKGGKTRKISLIPIKTHPSLPLSPRLAFVFPRGATRRSARPLPLRAHSHTQSRLRTLEPCHRLTLSLRAPLSGEPLALTQPVCCPAAGVRSATGTHL